MSFYVVVNFRSVKEVTFANLIILVVLALEILSDYLCFWIKIDLLLAVFWKELTRDL